MPDCLQQKIEALHLFFILRTKHPLSGRCNCRLSDMPSISPQYCRYGMPSIMAEGRHLTYGSEYVLAAIDFARINNGQALFVKQSKPDYQR